VSAAAPWSVKGIDPKAREIAKDLARRSGMTLGEWLNSMIMEDEDEGYATLPRRPSSAEAFDRRSRNRRIDDAYEGAGEGWQRISASIDAIAARLEAAERRSTVAIQGVDQAVAGLVRRLDSQDVETKTHARRLDDVSEELREGHRRLRAFERDMGPQTQETFGKVEASLGALAGRLYDIEERQRAGVNDLRQRMDAAEKAAGPGVGTDLLAQVGARLDQAQGRTTEALKTLERSFSELDRRMRAAEGRIEPEGARDAARFEKLAETLSRQIEGNRAEMMQRLDAAETGARIERVEHAVRSIGDQLKAAEQKGAQGIEAMGREVLRIARNLNGRMKAVEVDDATRAQAITRTVAARMDQEFARHAERIDQRLTAADDRNALALEKLGGEITLISDRLSDRIAQSERRSQQALEDIGRRLSESSDKIEQRYDRASGELAERMRMSEERTARLLAEARDSIDARGPTPIRDKPLDSSEANFASAPVAEPTANDDAIAVPAGGVEAAPAERVVQGDWRAAAFPDESFDAEDDWSSVPPPPEATAPFPMAPSSVAAETVAAAPEPERHTPLPPKAEPPIQPFGAMGGFGGADVDDALEATASAFVEPRAKPARAVFEAEDDAFDGDTDFVDPRQLRASMSAAAAAGRSASTRSAIDAARAAMAAPAEAEDEGPRQGFGLKPKRGGKSKLQERLDKQAARDGSTVRKTFLASVTAVALTGGVYGYVALTDGSSSPDVDVSGDDAAPLAAVARTSTAATPSLQPFVPGAADYDRAVQQLAAGEDAGVETLQRAANLGYAPAQAHLAALYQSGESGLEANLVESRRWARRAAEGGDAKGMHFYAMELFDGVGGPQNRAEALIWLQRAAERGLVDSQYNVARLYENGDDGIARNPTEALKWYTIAARAGDQQAQEALTRLTPAATAAAQRAARAAADAFQAQGAPRSSIPAQAMG
jgi:localization factor PodJL